MAHSPHLLTLAPDSALGVHIGTQILLHMCCNKHQCPLLDSRDMDDLDLTSTTSGLKSTLAGRQDADNMVPRAAEMSRTVRQRKSEVHLWEGHPLEGWSVKGRQGCTGRAGSPRAF